MVEFEKGQALVVPADKSWKVSRESTGGWEQEAFDDSSWKAAKEVALYGRGPWSTIGAGQLTLSPVKADPFFGTCELPADVDLRHGAHLVVEGLTPEAAARITVNGKDAGGFIGLPLRLPVASYLKPGINKIKIEPFAPTSARLMVNP